MPDEYPTEWAIYIPKDQTWAMAQYKGQYRSKGPWRTPHQSITNAKDEISKKKTKSKSPNRRPASEAVVKGATQTHRSSDGLPASGGSETGSDGEWQPAHTPIGCGLGAFIKSNKALGKSMGLKGRKLQAFIQAEIDKFRQSSSFHAELGSKKTIRTHCPPEGPAIGGTRIVKAGNPEDGHSPASASGTPGFFKKLKALGRDKGLSGRKLQEFIQAEIDKSRQMSLYPSESAIKIACHSHSASEGFPAIKQIQNVKPERLEEGHSPDNGSGFFKRLKFLGRDRGLSGRKLQEFIQAEIDRSRGTSKHR